MHSVKNQNPSSPEQQNRTDLVCTSAWREWRPHYAEEWMSKGENSQVKGAAAGILQNTRGKETEGSILFPKSTPAGICQPLLGSLPVPPTNKGALETWRKAAGGLVHEHNSGKPKENFHASEEHQHRAWLRSHSCLSITSHKSTVTSKKPLSVWLPQCTASHPKCSQAGDSSQTGANLTWFPGLWNFNYIYSTHVWPTVVCLGGKGGSGKEPFWKDTKKCRWF